MADIMRGIGFILTLISCSPLEGKTIYMSDFCDHTFNIEQQRVHEVVLKLTKHKTYWNNVECQMNFLTKPGHRLSFKITDMNLKDNNDEILLHGESTNATDGLHARIHGKSYDVYTTPGSKGIVTFTSNHAGNKGGFTILVTTFYNATNGKCWSGDFKCSNSRCIKSQLTCNKRDNCGDDSDEYNDCGNEESQWWIPIPCIIGGLVLVFWIWSCIKKKKAEKEAAAAAAKAKQTKTSKANTPGKTGDKKTATQTQKSTTKTTPQPTANDKATNSTKAPDSKDGATKATQTTQETTPDSKDTASKKEQDNAKTGEKQQEAALAPNSTTETCQQINNLENTISADINASSSTDKTGNLAPNLLAPPAMPIVTPIYINVVPLPETLVNATNRPGSQMDPPPAYATLMASPQLPLSGFPYNFLPHNSDIHQVGYLHGSPTPRPVDFQPAIFTPNQNCSPSELSNVGDKK